MEENSTHAVVPAKKIFNTVGFGLLTVAAVTIGLQLLLNTLAASGVIAVESAWLRWVLTFAPLYLVGVPLGLLIFRKAPADRSDGGKLGAGNFLLFLLMCFPLMYGGNLIGNLLSGLLSGGTAENPLNALAFDESPLRIVVIAVLAPLVEEFLFRKQLIDRTVRYGEKTAVLLSGLSFGLFHMNLFQFFYAFALGLLFAYLYVRTRRLRYTVALHMIVNFMGSVVAPHILSHTNMDALAEISGGQMTPEAMADLLPQVGGLMLYAFALITLSIIGLIVLLVKLPKFRFRPAEQELPKNEVFSTVYLRPGYLLFALTCMAVCTLHLLGVA